MIVYRSIEQIKAPLQKPVATIGNFDGVHLGHREMFRKLNRAAKELGGVSIVITFDPHPLKVLPASRSIALINTVEEKINLIEASGVDYLLIIPFNTDFASLSAAAFVKRILIDTIGIKRLIIGYDYAFGKGREGDALLLRKFGDMFDFTVEELPPISDGSINYSSSHIRRLVSVGSVAEVIPYLGRNFSFSGRVVHGANRGKLLGFPTANIATDKELLPAEGVYAVKVKIDGAIYDAACNIGYNPTFESGKKSIEVYIFDLDDDLYGKEIRVYFFERLRGEKQFNSATELVAAITDDVVRCREILAASQLVVYREYLEGI